MGRFLRVAGAIVGVLMVLVGLIWILQGLNLLPGSFMTGQIIWAIYGAPLAGAGAALTWMMLRRR